MKAKRIHQKRQAVAGYYILGTDPGKENHCSALLDPNGQQLGTTFTFTASRAGYDEALWKHLKRRLPEASPQNLIVAIETSCNLWITLAHYFHERGYPVVRVIPLTTRHARPVLHQDFSQTDPRDAFVIADCARGGSYHLFQTFTPDQDAAHHLSIAYDKLRKDYTRHILRLRALMEQVFPEYLGAFNIKTKTSLYLLERAFLPQHFLELDVETVGAQIKRISRGKHGVPTLKKLQAWAHSSVGIPIGGQEAALRLSLDGWIDALQRIETQLKRVEKAMIAHTQNQRTFQIVDSLPNINKNLAAQFTAEVRDATRFSHYKQIEKLAGSNVRVKDSEKYKGKRRMSKLGNSRLRRILFQMAQQTARDVPKIRKKFLRGELKKKCYRKNIVAATSVMLQLIVALLKDDRLYEQRPEEEAALKPLERRYRAKYKPKRVARRTSSRAAA